MNTVKLQKNSTRMVAHRGVSGLEKENSMAAFVAAGSRSYWGIETDIHRTSDGQFVAIHDSNTARVTGKSMIVEETALEDLRELTLLDEYGLPGRADLRIPLLQEYIGACKKYEKTAVLELKKRFGEEDIARIIEIIQSEDYLQQTVFIAFDTENLRAVRRCVPGQPVQQLSDRLTEELLDMICREGYALDIAHAELTEAWVQRLHEKGIMINCWTVDSAARAEELIAWGVDMITTDILE